MQEAQSLAILTVWTMRVITGQSRLPGRLCSWCPKRALTSAVQLAELRQRLRSYRPVEVFGETARGDGQFWTVDDLAQAIARWYGVRYAPPGSYVALLKHSGYSYQRPTKVYRSRSEAQAQAFVEELAPKTRCGPE